jgi:predicted amidohydrolase YtcJ
MLDGTNAADGLRRLVGVCFEPSDERLEVVRRHTLPRGRDTSSELQFMRRALSVNEVLASLTTNPAAYFGAARKGRVESGFDADVVVLDEDPADDVRNLGRVAYTIRGGNVI